MFFHHDTAGGWLRLDTKLKLNGLKLTGAKVPANPSDIPSAVADDAAVCVSEGAVDLVTPDKSIPFKSLIKILEEKGILQPTLTKSKQAPTKPIETALRGEHRAEVFIHKFLLKHSLAWLQINKVVSRHDLADVDETNTAPENDIEIEVEFQPDLPVSQTADLNSAFPDTDVPGFVENPAPQEPLVMTAEDALKRITEENQKLVSHIEALESNSSTLKTTINTLENQIATGITNLDLPFSYQHISTFKDRNGLTVDLQTIVSTAVQDSMQALRSNFANDVSLEVKALITR